MARKSGIFISYSHKDAVWLERLKTVLKPLTRNETIEVWDDTRISPGADWRAEIDRGMATARAAILLVSADFLASDFINDIEMKATIEARAKGMGFFWIPLSHSLYEETPLEGIQAAWNPKKPLDTLPAAEQTAALVTIARSLKSALNVNAVAQTMGVADAIYPQLAAYAADPQQPPSERESSLRVEQRGAAVSFETREGVSFRKITAEDLDRLDPPSQQLIRAHERAINELYDRWTELYPKRIAADEVVRGKARQDLDLIKQDLCQELRAILDFLQRLGLDLHDHYAHLHQICA